MQIENKFIEIADGLIEKAKGIEDLTVRLKTMQKLIEKTEHVRKSLAFITFDGAFNFCAEMHEIEQFIQSQKTKA